MRYISFLNIRNVFVICNLLISFNSLAVTDVTSSKKETKPKETFSNGSEQQADQDDLLWFDFHFKWDDLIPPPIAMGQRLLDAPAGKHGYLKPDGENLIFEDGTPYKLWGVNIAFSQRATSDSMPPPKKVAGKLADKIASMGFNHVRFIGFDGNAPQAMENWRKTGKVESVQLDRLDYFIKELRNRGVYYSFSLHNGSYPLFKDDSRIKANSKKKNYQAYRTIRMFDEHGRKQLTAWAKAFFDHKNPYTGLTFAKDPANVYYSSMNEDTAFLAHLTNLKHYDKYWKKRINNQFSKFLISKYKSRDQLTDAWSEFGAIGLLPTEDPFQSDISIKPNALKLGASTERRRDTARFLFSVNDDLNKILHQSLSDIGYKGLLSGNSKWYGIGSLYSDYVTGNYIEGHVYFGQNNRLRKKEKGHFKFGNNSYLDLMVSGDDGFRDLLKNDRFGLSRIVPANLIDRPYIISEWNHSIWSDYAYEGAYLLIGYGSRMGVDGMDVQILYNHPHPTFTDSLPRTKHTVMGNPLHMAIFPTLALAFQRQDVEQVSPKKIVCLGKNTDELFSRALERPRLHEVLDNAVLEYGIDFVRTAIGSECDNKRNTDFGLASNMSSRVSLAKTDSGRGRLEIISERFEAIVGDISSSDEDKESVLEANLEYAGSLSLISLNESELKVTSCMLLTVAGPIRNKDAVWYYVDGAKVMNTVGRKNPQMRGNKGVVTLRLSDPNKDHKVYSVSVRGDMSEVTADTSKSFDGVVMKISIDELKSPWLLVGDANCTRN